MPEGWTLGATNVRNGWTKFTLDHDRVGQPALIVRLTADCDTTGATATPSDQPGTRRYERTEPGQPAPTTTYTVFPGGCVTAELRSTNNGDTSLIDEAASAIGFTTRPALQQALDQRSNGQLHLDPRESGMTISDRHRPEPAKKGPLMPIARWCSPLAASLVALTLAAALAACGNDGDSGHHRPDEHGTRQASGRDP